MTDGYDVYIYGVGDALSGINRVQFATWTTYGGQDDIQNSWQTSKIASGTNLENGTWYYHVSIYDHNNEHGDYNTHVYIYDNAGNSILGGSTSVTVPTTCSSNCTTKNLVTNGSFEDGISEWGNYDSNDVWVYNYDNSSFAKYGTKTLRIAFLKDSQAFLRTAYPNVNNLQGHKIYAKVSVLVESSKINPYFYLEFTEKADYWYNENNPNDQYFTNMMTVYGKIDTQKWLSLSNYTNYAKYNYLKIMLAQGNNDDVIGSILHFDGLLVVDLTSTFGSGNEPDKEWCDSNINYFDGITTIYK